MRGSWRPNRTAIYWPRLLWPSALCLSRPPDAQPEARGLNFLLSASFLYHILSPTGLQNFWGPRGPLLLSGGFPYHILYPTSLFPNSIRGPKGSLRRAVAFSTTSCLYLVWLPTLWLPVLTELYNSSTPTQSLEWHVWSSSSGNNCHAVHRSLSSGALVYECIMGFLPCPISSAKSAYAISFDYWPLGCVTSFRCITLEWHVWPGRRSKYNTTHLSHITLSQPFCNHFE